MSRSRLALLGGRPVLGDWPRPRWPVITAADLEVLVDVISSDEISYTGREGHIGALEDRIAGSYGAAHALATSSGTAALHSAYFGIGLQPGDEVLAPTYTYLATVMPILVCNAVPVLVDADPHTGDIDPLDLERHLTARTAALVVTHNAGVPLDMGPLVAFARRHGLRLIEDCCHAHGAICAGQKVGTFGDAAVLSFQTKKLVPAGEGGMLITDDREIYERALLLGHARERTLKEVTSEAYRSFAGTGFGLKYRIHPCAAALAGRQLDRLDESISARIESLGKLSRRLSAARGIRPPLIRDHVDRPVYYSYRPVYCPEELDNLPIEVFVRALQCEGVPIERPRAQPLHTEPFFQTTNTGIRTYQPISGEPRVYRPGDLPNSELYASRVLRFPSFDEDLGQHYDLLTEALDKVSVHLDELLEHAAGPELAGPAGAKAP